MGENLRGEFHNFSTSDDFSVVNVRQNVSLVCNGNSIDISRRSLMEFLDTTATTTTGLNSACIAVTRIGHKETHTQTKTYRKKWKYKWQTNEITRK